MNADRPDPRANDAGAVRSDGHPDTSRGGYGPAVSGRVSTLDRVTLQLGVAVAVVIALCSYAVSATSLYALGRGAGYAPWQAVAVPVVADGPAIYGMFRIVSRSRRNAKGAGYGWLLVVAGTAASIGGNIAHAQPDLVAQGIAAAIPLAVLAMLEGLKGDAGEVARLAAVAGQVSIPDAQANPPGLDGQAASDTVVRRLDAPDGSVSGVDGRSAGALAAPPAAADAGVQARLRAAYAQDRPDRGRGRRGRWPRRPAVAARPPRRSCALNVNRLEGRPREVAPEGHRRGGRRGQQPPR